MPPLLRRKTLQKLIQVYRRVILSVIYDGTMAEFPMGLRLIQERTTDDIFNMLFPVITAVVLLHFFKKR